jgi:hypothetical protein
MTAKSETIRIRILCHTPPGTDGSIKFGLQDKTPALHPGTLRDDGILVFECELEVKPGKNPIQPNFLGAFAHGTPEARFLYLSYGTQQNGSWHWIKRIKIMLTGITWEQINAAGESGQVLEASIDGSKAATVKLMGEGWTLSDAS